MRRRFRPYFCLIGTFADDLRRYCVVPHSHLQQYSLKKVRKKHESDIDTNVDTLEYNTFVDIVSRSVSMCKHSKALRVDALGQVAAASSHHHRASSLNGYTPVDTTLASNALVHFKIV